MYATLKAETPEAGVVAIVGTLPSLLTASHLAYEILRWVGALAFGVPLAGLHVILGTTRTALLIGLARRLRILLGRPVARRVA